MWDDQWEQRDWTQQRPVRFWDAFITILVTIVVMLLLTFAVLLNVGVL